MRATSDDQFPLSGDGVTSRDAANRARRYAQLADRVTHLVASAAYWGEDAHVPELNVLLRRLAEAPHGDSGDTLLHGLVRYPALLAMYAAGVAMVARQEYSRLSDILGLEMNIDRERRPLLAALSSRHILTEAIEQELQRSEHSSRTPASDELYEALRPSFSDLIPSDDEYADVFDRFEYLLSLAEADWWITSGESARFSGGRFGWRPVSGSSDVLPSFVAAELARDGTAWLPLGAGMFGGDMTGLQAAKTAVDESEWGGPAW